MGSIGIANLDEHGEDPGNGVEVVFRREVL